LVRKQTNDANSLLANNKPVLMDLDKIVNRSEDDTLDFTLDGQLMKFTFSLQSRDEKYLVDLYETYRKSTVFVEWNSKAYFFIRKRMAEILVALTMNLRSSVYLDKAFTALNNLLKGRQIQKIPLGKTYVNACIVAVHLPFFEDEIDIDLVSNSFDIAVQGYEPCRFPKNYAILNAWAGILHAWCGLGANSRSASKRQALDGLACIELSQQCPRFENDPRDFDLMAGSIDVARDTLDYVKNNPIDDFTSWNDMKNKRKVHKSARNIVKDETKKWGISPPLDKWLK